MKGTIRVAGSNASSEGENGAGDSDAAEKETPGFGAGFLGIALAGGLLLRRRAWR